MKLALLSNVTVELLAAQIRKENHDVYLPAGFNTWQQEIMIPTSGLYGFKPEAVIILLHAGACSETWDRLEKGQALIDEWCKAFHALVTGLPGIPVFVSSVDIEETCCYGAEERLSCCFEKYLSDQIQKMHCHGDSVYLLPVKESVMALGRSSFYSSKMWYLGSMPYSVKGLAALSELIIRYASVRKGMRRKCLAVDLDNTLWGGVIGEDGVNGIVLSNSKEGARYKDVQRLLKKMKERGVMLAILSKNNAADVEPVFLHPDMVLQHEDFVAEIINWDQKSANIRKLSHDLNIGLDAFVFLDDNPAEREMMKAEHPEVAVIDFPRDSSMLPDTIARAYEQYFLALELTGEDSHKTAMYRADRQRKAEMAASVSVEDYLKRLEMTMDIHFMRADEETRVVQLVNKTNQFNVTTKRYGEEEIQAMAESSDYDLITVHMSDKYGVQGLVAVLILKYRGHEAEIDTFLMSCRVMGRNAETEILARIRALMEKRKIDTVYASYIKTSKNTPVADLYERMGFLVRKMTNSQKQYEIRTEELPDLSAVFKEVRSDL